MFLHFVKRGEQRPTKFLRLIEETIMGALFAGVVPQPFGGVVFR
jgi:hypothetical protein